MINLDSENGSEKKIDDRFLARREDSLPLMQLPIVEQFLWCLSQGKSLVGWEMGCGRRLVILALRI